MYINSVEIDGRRLVSSTGGEGGGAGGAGVEVYCGG